MIQGPTTGEHTKRAGLLMLTPLRVAAGLLLGVLVGLSLILAVPSVRAQVGLFLGRLFVISVGETGSAVVSSEFTPLYPAAIPDRLNFFATTIGGEPGSMYTELRYYNQTEFIVVYEAQAAPDEALPDGEAIQIGDQSAVLLRGLSGTVYLTTGEAQEDRPSTVGGGGGGGGGGSIPPQPPPVSLEYVNGNTLVWLQHGLRIELLSNLPLEELVQVASAMVGAEEISQEDLPDVLEPAPLEAPGDGSPPMFEPLRPAYVPAGFYAGGTLGATGENGVPVVEWRVHDDERFIILVQTLVRDGDALPDGETVMLNGERPAVVERGLSGMAVLAPYALQDGTRLGPAPSPPVEAQSPFPAQVVYTDGIRLTWFAGELKLVLLSNLPETEALLVAESVEPEFTPSEP